MQRRREAAATDLHAKVVDRLHLGAQRRRGARTAHLMAVRVAAVPVEAVRRLARPPRRLETVRLEEQLLELA